MGFNVSVPGMTKAALTAAFVFFQLRGKDLNLRPLGYEPNELPLLHPAVLLQYIGLGDGASMDIVTLLRAYEGEGVAPVGEAQFSQGADLECIDCAAF